MYDPYDPQTYIREYASDRLVTVIKIATFVQRNLVALHKSIDTEDDARERDELLADMLILNASLSMLNLAYFSENDEVIEAVKDLVKQTAR